MANFVQERYNPVLVGVNSTVTLPHNSVGIFLCTVSGTLTINVAKADARPAYTLLTAFAVTAGTTYKIPFYLGTNGGSVTTAGGAAGVLGV